MGCEDGSREQVVCLKWNNLCRGTLGNRTLRGSKDRTLGSLLKVPSHRFSFEALRFLGCCWISVKLNIQKTKIMASSPITSWEIDGETVETVADFIFLGSKITADGDWSHEIKRRLLLGGRVMTNLDSILKSRDITLPTKVHLVMLCYAMLSHFSHVQLCVTP